jgi:very-short-patch-repair endonuclease
MNLRPFEAFAATHHSLLHRDAALALGASRTTWYRAIDRGVFEQLHPNVVRVIGSPRTRQQQILAAVWAAGLGAVASHRSAAFLWGVERSPDDPVDVILPARTRNSAPAGVVVHRPRDLRELRPVVRQAIPSVTPMRMLVDLGAVDAPGVEPALDDVLTQRLASFDAIQAGLYRHARRGHHGIAALRAALAQWQIEGRVSDAKLEQRMHELLEEHALPPAEFHATVCGYEVDFLVTGTRIVLECDGWESHGLDRDQFEFDRLRDSELTAAGYVVVHFTWRQITSGARHVARRIEENLRRWAPEVLARRRSSTGTRPNWAP